MLRLPFNALFNVLIALRFGLGWLFRQLPFRRPPIAVWVRVHGDLPYLMEPRRVPVFFRWLNPVKRRHPQDATSLRQLSRDLAVLAKEKHVRALVVHLESFEGSGATLTALTQAAQFFREQNKPVWGYSRMATTGEYRFFAGLDKFLLGPGGRLELAGYQAEVLSLKNTLGLVGVRPQFVRRGEFKTAPEMFTRDRISPAQEQTLSTILDERAEVLTQAIALGRHLPVPEAKDAIDHGPYSGKRAKEAHLADGVADPREIEEQLKEQIGKNLESVPYGHLEGYAQALRPKFRPMRRPRYSAVVPVRGLINLGDGRTGSGPKVAGSDSVVASLEQAAEDKSARSILLYIDSGGGSAIASELIHAAVKRAAKEKPVIAYFDKIAASGGYMAAVGAKEIWCAPEALAGSIGVFAGKFDVEGLLGFLQVGVDAIRRGTNAGMYSLMRPWSESELAVMEREVEETYRDFVHLVAEGRRTTDEAIHAVGEGRVFTGTRAHQAKLVDGLCDFATAINKVHALGGLEPDAPLAWVDASPRVVSPLSLLRGNARQYLWALAEPLL
jgi:protease-4